LNAIVIFSFQAGFVHKPQNEVPPLEEIGNLGLSGAGSAGG